ncbi:MAG: hypothetical protein JXA50_01890 [Deltaproteobacteria bacterium]|nr:hypothetical protein [Deltaproteobacteria bacterium]
MAADIYLSNLNPNQKWFAKLSDAGDNALVELFNSQADAEAGTSRVAYGSFAFGTEIEVVLTNDTEEPDIEFAKDQDSWHLKATFLDGDPTKIVRFGPITDLSEVIDPLLTTDQACQDRARLEMDRHTKIEVSSTLSLGTHIQGLEADDKRKLTDNMRGLDQQVRVDDIQIMIDKDSIKDIITVTEFEEVKR